VPVVLRRPPIAKLPRHGRGRNVDHRGLRCRDAL